eukprot:m.488054 g.488054  ORF g.488054 m.488054 type:complete len:59 (-) comp86247_c0_seq1:64-240(-)
MPTDRPACIQQNNVRSTDIDPLDVRNMNPSGTVDSPRQRHDVNSAKEAHLQAARRGCS